MTDRSDVCVEAAEDRAGDTETSTDVLERVLERYSAIATLCHKLNNPLTAILGRAQILGMKAGDDENVKRVADVIEESAGRMAAYIRELANEAASGRADVERSRHEKD